MDWWEPTGVLSNLDQVPPANPHNRRTGPAEEEEEDLVDKLIRKTGCEKEHFLVQVFGVVLIIGPIWVSNRLGLWVLATEIPASRRDIRIPVPL